MSPCLCLGPLSNNGAFVSLCCVAMLGEDAVLWLLTSEVLRFYPPWRTVFGEHESCSFQAKAYCSPKKPELFLVKLEGR